MKPNFKVRITILVIIGLFLFLSSLTCINPYFKTKNDKNEAYIEEFTSKNIKSSISSAVSGVIHINNNWTEAKGIGICTGEGTYSNPYVIQDWVIDGSGIGACILIENSDVYFRLENCTVFNSGENSLGINLYNVNNSQIINNTCSTYQDGISLFYSNNNTISVNKVNNITDSDGISLYQSDNNIISKNIINNSGNNGIRVGESNNNFISENNVTFNYYNGITLGNSDNNIISENTVNNCLNGIFLSSSFRNNILRNTANNNSDGIRLDYSYYNVISQNNGEYNHNGIFLFRSVGNSISGNILNKNLLGIGIFYNSNDNLISKNTVNHNTNGIELSHSDKNSISRNTANNNDECGIYLFDSDHNIISGNTLEGNEICIKELACRNNIFFNNGSCFYRNILFQIIPLLSIVGIGIVIAILTTSLIKTKRKKAL